MRIFLYADLAISFERFLVGECYSSMMLLFVKTLLSNISEYNDEFDKNSMVSDAFRTRRLFGRRGGFCFSTDMCAKIHAYRENEISRCCWKRLTRATSLSLSLSPSLFLKEKVPY